MSNLSAERGMVSFKVLFWLLVLFIVVHIGIKLVPMYINSERMKDEMSVKAELAQTLSDNEILTDLVKKAKELNLPIGQEDIVLTRNEDTHMMKISAKWDETVHFFF